MPKLLTAFAIATMVIATSGVWKANAATITNAGTLAPLTKSYTPAEKIAYWRRQYRRAYRRGYYGYGYRPSYGTDPIMVMATDAITVGATRTLAIS